MHFTTCPGSLIFVIIPDAMFMGAIFTLRVVQEFGVGLALD
jgi:hypothetical protein